MIVPLPEPMHHPQTDGIMRKLEKQASEHRRRTEAVAAERLQRDLHTKELKVDGIGSLEARLESNAAVARMAANQERIWVSGLAQHCRLLCTATAVTPDARIPLLLYVPLFARSPAKLIHPNPTRLPRAGREAQRRGRV